MFEALSDAVFDVINAPVKIVEKMSELPEKFVDSIDDLTDDEDDED